MPTLRKLNQKWKIKNYSEKLGRQQQTNKWSLWLSTLAAKTTTGPKGRQDLIASFHPSQFVGFYRCLSTQKSSTKKDPINGWVYHPLLT